MFLLLDFAQSLQIEEILTLHCKPLHRFLVNCSKTVRDISVPFLFLKVTRHYSLKFYLPSVYGP